MYKAILKSIGSDNNGWGFYNPRTSCSVINRSLRYKYSSNSIHHHESIHGSQFYTSSYGFFIYLLTSLQSQYAIKAYIQENSNTDLKFEFPSLDNGEGFCGQNNEDITRFYQLEALHAILDGNSNPFISSYSSIKNLSQLFIFNPIIGVLSSPKIIYNSHKFAKNNSLELLNYDWDLDSIVPTLPFCDSFGAADLLESSAIANQLIMKNVLNNHITGKEPRYRSAQYLYFQVITKYIDNNLLEDLHTKSLNSNIFVSRLKLQPLELLINLFATRSSYYPSKNNSYRNALELHPLIEGTKTRTVSLLFLFNYIVDLAINPPISLLLDDFNESYTWYDFHPGWRFIRIMNELEKIIKNKKLQGKDFFEIIIDLCNNKGQFIDDVCITLSWPTKKKLYSLLVSHFFNNTISFFFNLYYDINSLNSRIYYLLRGLLRNYPWCEDVVDPEIRLEKGNRDLLLYRLESQFNLYHKDVSKMPACCLIDRKKGRTVKEFKADYAEASSFLFDLSKLNEKTFPDYRTIDKKSTKRALISTLDEKIGNNLEELISILPFRHDIFRRFVIGSKGDISEELCLESCSNKSKNWHKVKESYDNLLEKIFTDILSQK